MIGLLKKCLIVLFFPLFASFCATFLFALPYDTGIDPSLLWVKKTKTQVYTKLIVKNGILYFGDLNNYIYALSSQDAGLLWKKLLKARDKGKPKGIRSSFILYKASLIAVSVDGFLYALDAKTGKVLWGPIDLGEEVYSSPVVVDGYLFIVTAKRARIFTINVLTGRLILKKMLGFPVYTTPLVHPIRVVDKGITKKLYNVYITLSKRLLFFRIHIENKVILDITTIPIFNKDNYVSSPVIYSAVSKRNIRTNTLFFASSKYVYSVNADLLTINWLARSGAIFINKNRKNYPSPFIVGDKIFLSNLAYDRELGSPVWNVFLYGLATTDSAYTKSCVYFGGRYISYGDLRGYIACVDRKTEGIIFHKTLPSFPLSPITVMDKIIYFSTEDNKIYAFK